MLLERIGPKPGFLAAELEKTLTFAGDNHKVTEEEVGQVVGDIHMEKVFSFTDALKEKNGEKVWPFCTTNSVMERIL